MPNEKYLNVRISEELRQALRDKAYKDDVRISNVVRKILEDYFGINNE